MSTKCLLYCVITTMIMLDAEMDEAESPDDQSGEAKTAKEIELYDESNTEEYQKLGNVVILGTKPTTDAKVREFTKNIDLENVIVDVELADLEDYGETYSIDEEIEHKKDVNRIDSNSEENTVDIKLQNYVEKNFIDEGIEFKTEIDNIGTSELLLVENYSHSSCIKVEDNDPLELTVNNDSDENYGFKITAIESKVEMYEDDVKSDCMSSPSLKLVYSSEDESVELDKSPNNNIESDVNAKNEIQDHISNVPEVNDVEEMDILNEIDELIRSTSVNKLIEHKASNDLVDTIVILDDDNDDDVIMENEDNVLNHCNNTLVNESNHNNDINITAELMENNIVSNNIVNDIANVNDSSNKLPKVNIKEEIKTLDDDEIIIIEDDADEIIIIEDDADEIRIIKDYDHDVVIKDETEHKIEYKQEIVKSRILKSKRRKLQPEKRNCQYKCIICSKKFLDYYGADNHRKFYHGHMTNRFTIRKLVKAKKQKLKPGYLKQLYSDIFQDLKSELLKVKTSELEDISMIKTDELLDKSSPKYIDEINNGKSKKIKIQDAVNNKEKQIPMNDKAKMIDLYKCHCGLHYLLRHSLFRHAKTCNRNEIEEDLQKCFICHLACSKTLFFEHLKQHEESRNWKFNIIDIDLADSNIETPTDDGVLTQKTDENPKKKAANASVLRLKKHHRKLRKLKPKSYKEDDDDDVAIDNMRCYFRCFKCATAYESMRGVERHIAGGHKRSYSVICQICKLRVNSKMFESHKSVHKDIDDFCINIVGPDCKIVERYIHRTVKETSVKTSNKINDESEDLSYESDSTNEDNSSLEDFEDTFQDGESYSKIYKCKSCPVHFPTIATFLEHIFKRVHGDSNSCSSNEESRFCQYCGRIFYTKCIDEHEKIHHEDKTVGDTLLVIDKDPSKVIKAQSSEAKILKSLKSRYKSKEKNNRNRPKISVENKSKDSGDKRIKQNHKSLKDLKDNTMKIKHFKCPKCSLHLNNQHSYGGHLRHCKFRKTFPCKYCGDEFTEFGLKKHKKACMHTNTNLSRGFNDSNKPADNNVKNDISQEKTTSDKNENHINLIENEFVDNLVSKKDKIDDIAINKELEVLENENEQIGKQYTIYKCAHCSTHLNNLTSIYIHLRYAKHIEDIDGIKCQTCKLKFSVPNFIDHANMHFKNKAFKVETFETVDDIVKSLTGDNKAEKTIDESNSLTEKLRAVRIARLRKYEDLNTDDDYPTIEEITKVFNDLEEEAIKILHEKKTENKLQGAFNNELYKLMIESRESTVERISVQQLIEASLESKFRQSDYPNLSAAVVNKTNSVINNFSAPVYSYKNIVKNATNISNSAVYNKSNTTQAQVKHAKKPRKSIFNYDIRATTNVELASLPANLETYELTNLASNDGIYDNRMSLNPNSNKYIGKTQTLPIDYSIKTNNVILKKTLPKQQAKKRKQVPKKVSATKTSPKDINSHPKIVSYNVNNYDNSNNVYFVENNTSVPINSVHLQNASNNTKIYVTKQIQDNINGQRHSVININPIYSDTNNYVVNNTNTCNSSNAVTSNTYYTINGEDSKIPKSCKNYKVPYNCNPVSQSSTTTNANNKILNPQIDKYASIISKELGITCTDKLKQDKNDVNEPQNHGSNLALSNVERPDKSNISYTKTNNNHTRINSYNHKENKNVSASVGAKVNNNSNKNVGDVVPNVTVQVIHPNTWIDLTEDNEVNIVRSSNDIGNSNTADSSISNHALFERLLRINDERVRKLLEDLFKKNATQKYEE